MQGEEDQRFAAHAAIEEEGNEDTSFIAADDGDGDDPNEAEEGEEETYMSAIMDPNKERFSEYSF